MDKVFNIPFGKPLIDSKEINLVNEVLSNPVLVHGPKSKEFEESFSKFTGASNSISVSSCTAGMHLIYFTLGIPTLLSDRDLPPRSQRLCAAASPPLPAPEGHK